MYQGRLLPRRGYIDGILWSLWSFDRRRVHIFAGEMLSPSHVLDFMSKVSNSCLTIMFEIMCTAIRLPVFLKYISEHYPIPSQIRRCRHCGNDPLTFPTAPPASSGSDSGSSEEEQDSLGLFDP
jgi:hypothetical protein